MCFCLQPQTNSAQFLTFYFLELFRYSCRNTNWTGFSKLAPNATEVEQIAERLELRRSERIPVTFGARVRFLKGCRSIAKSKNYEHSRISKKDLLEYQACVHAEWDSGKGIFNGPLVRALSIKSDCECLMQIVDRAVTMMEKDRVDTGNWLYYRDFSFDYTRIVSRWPHMRSELGVAAMVICLYYALTPILFCVIMPSSNICQAPGYEGVVATFYFASTTVRVLGSASRQHYGFSTAKECLS